MRVVYATRQNAPDYMPQARVIGRGSSGIATFATVLDVKYADCHTPRCPCPQWFDYSSPHSVSRYSYGDTAIKGLSLRRGGESGLMRLDHRPHHWARGVLPKWRPLWGLLSPFDTYIIPHIDAFVKWFWEEIL